MSDLISGVVSIRTFLNDNLEKIGYVHCGQLREWELKKSRKYIIPGYQREMKWSADNVQILFDDLLESSKFLGNILLSTSDLISYEIIDGQQRLTAIFMLLEKVRIKKHDGTSVEFCTYENETFPYFERAIQSNFIFSNDDEKRVVLESDVLNQYDTMKELWECVCKNIENLTEQEIIRLEDHLLDSRVSVLISTVDPSRNESRRLCVDYFIDINNKSVKLDCADILKAYAFREDFNNASNKWIKIQKQEHELESIYYPKETLFYHYFLCTINKYLDYGVSGLSETYKISKRDVHFGDKDYLIGTDIEILLYDTPYFYRNMLDRILKYQDFMRIVQRDKTSPSEEFCNYFSCGAPVDYNTKHNAFVIISGILKNSDVVPKLLVMKYFLEVLSVEEKTKDDLKLIYWINVLAAFFSAARTKRKSTDSFASIVLKEDWKKMLYTSASKKLNAFPNGIGFDKEIYQDGKSTSVSGQYLARRMHGIFASYIVSSQGTWRYDEERYKRIMNTSGAINDEHLLINKSGKVSFKYSTLQNVGAIELPKNVKSKVSYISNYIVIKGSINSEMENRTIDEKIQIIRKHLEQGEEDVFADKFSEYLFEKVVSFYGDSGCPTAQELMLIEDREEAKQLVEAYYSSIFIDRFNEYIESLYEDDNVLVELCSV